MTTGRRWVMARAAAIVASFLVMTAAWLLAAPPGASPDDGYHLGSIWCAEGFKDGICVQDLGSPDRSRGLVPQAVVALPCFTYDGSVSAACQLEALDSGFLRLVPSITNLDGARPNLYYRAAHRLIGDGQDVGPAVARIRSANAAVTAAMVLLTALVADRRLRSAFLLSWIITAVPLGMFLITSVNSSAWGLAGLTTFWANAMTAVDHPDRRNRASAAVLAAIGVVMGLGSRTEAVAHIAVITVTLLVMWLWARRAAGAPGTSWLDRRRMIIGGALLAVAGVLLVLAAPRSAGLSNIVRDLGRGHARIAAREVGDPFLAIAFEVPTL